MCSESMIFDSRRWRCYCAAYPQDDDYNFQDDDYEEEFDCGFVPGVGCLDAGSEDCDWECPYSHELHNHPDYPNVKLYPGFG